MKTKTPNREWYTSGHLAEYFDVSRATILRWLKDIPTEYKISITGPNVFPGRRRYHKKVIEIIIKNLRNNN